MTRLVKVELRRFFARRLTLIGTAAAVIVTGLLLFAVWRDSAPLPEAQQRQAQQAYEQARAEWERTGRQQIENCRQTERSTMPDGSSVCDHMEPRPEHFGKPVTVFKETAPDYLLGVSFLAAFVAFLIGAGFMGAEFSSGSIANWLTFVPRRLRVYWSKLLAAAAGPVPIAVGLGALMLAGSWLIVGHHGTTAGTTGDVWTDLVSTAGRGVGLAAVAGVAGVALGGLLRHTAAALGIAMGLHGDRRGHLRQRPAEAPAVADQRQLPELDQARHDLLRERLQVHGRRRIRLRERGEDAVVHAQRDVSRPARARPAAGRCRRVPPPRHHMSERPPRAGGRA
jgi:ABC-2 type transport system permease protein